jgi:hypothetical protein
MLIWAKGDTRLMAGWKFHLFSGFLIVGALLVLYFLSYFAIPDQKDLFFLVVAAFAVLLGSDLPDFDSRRTKIKYALGPILGMALACFYMIHVDLDILPLSRIYAQWGDYSGYLLRAFVILVACVILNTLVWFFPLSHRGRAHSLVAAVLYAVAWSVFCYFLLDLGLVHSLAVGALGCIGYLAHLLLDRDIKVWG